MKRLDVRANSPTQPVGQLSGGNQQKIAFGRLLHQQADVLLLDEPTRGIDVGAKAVLYRQMLELAQQGKAVVMVSSYLPELLGMCDTIGVMCRGELVAVRPREQWDEHSLLNAALGRDAAPRKKKPTNHSHTFPFMSAPSAHRPSWFKRFPLLGPLFGLTFVLLLFEVLVYHHNGMNFLSPDTIGLILTRRP